MIEPTRKDLGKKVVHTDNINKTEEEGTIYSFNNLYIFVRFKDGVVKACTRASLEWKQ